MIKEHRSKIQYSSSRLRRARLLYFNIITPKIPEGIEGVRLVNEISVKLQERGLYSMKTNNTDICFSIYRHMYKRTSNKYDSWYSWLAEHGYGHHPWFRKAA